LDECFDATATWAKNKVAVNKVMILANIKNFDFIISSFVKKNTLFLRRGCPNNLQVKTVHAAPFINGVIINGCSSPQKFSLIKRVLGHNFMTPHIKLSS
jgi:hypothetical protein